MHRVWGKPDMGRLRGRLIEVVDALRRDIDSGNTRDCQTAIEDLSDSFIELEESDVPATTWFACGKSKQVFGRPLGASITIGARSSFPRHMP